MLANEYRLEIQFKKVGKVRNINNNPMVGSRPLECRPLGLRRTDFTASLNLRAYCKLINYFETFEY